MQNYVVLSNTGNIGGGKKMSVESWETSPYAMPDTPSETEGTLDGSTVQSIGVGKLRWTFVAFVVHGGEATGYATADDVRSWFTGNSLATSILKFQDMYDTTVYDVVLVNRAIGNDWKTEGKLALHAKAVYKIKFDLRQV